MESGREITQRFPKKKEKKKKRKRFIYLFFRSFFDWVFISAKDDEKEKDFSFFLIIYSSGEKISFLVDCVVCVYTRKNK